MDLLHNPLFWGVTAVAACILIIVIYNAVTSFLDNMFRTLPIPVSAILCGTPVGLLAQWLARKIYLAVLYRQGTVREFAPDKIRLTAYVFIAVSIILFFIWIYQNYHIGNDHTEKTVQYIPGVVIYPPPPLRKSKESERQFQALTKECAASPEFREAVAWLKERSYDRMMVTDTHISVCSVSRSSLSGAAEEIPNYKDHFPINLKSNSSLSSTGLYGGYTLGYAFATALKEHLHLSVVRYNLQPEEQALDHYEFFVEFKK